MVTNLAYSIFLEFLIFPKGTVYRYNSYLQLRLFGRDIVDTSLLFHGSHQISWDPIQVYLAERFQYVRKTHMSLYTWLCVWYLVQVCRALGTIAICRALCTQYSLPYIPRIACIWHISVALQPVAGCLVELISCIRVLARQHSCLGDVGFL